MLNEVGLKKLTKQENKVAALVSLGYFEKEIADKLCNNVHTIHTYLRNIRKKLGAKNIADIKFSLI